MEDRIKVCLISFMFSPLVGGAEVRAEKQAHQLQTLGQEVMVVTLRINKAWKQTETLDGLPIVRVGGGIYRRNGWLHIGRLGHFPIDMALLRAGCRTGMSSVCSSSSTSSRGIRCRSAGRSRGGWFASCVLRRG